MHIAIEPITTSTPHHVAEHDDLCVPDDSKKETNDNAAVNHHNNDSASSPRTIMGAASSEDDTTDTTTTTTPATLDGFMSDPAPMRPDAWSAVAGTEFQIRSKDYLDDRRKCASDDSVFQLILQDVVKVVPSSSSISSSSDDDADREGSPSTNSDNDTNLLENVGLCSLPNERVQKALARERNTGIRQLPEFFFAVNLVLPSIDESSGLPCSYHCISYFGIDDKSILTDETTPFGRVARPFFFGDSDEHRDQTFKLIPRIVEGNFLVKNAVGGQPAILGRNLKTSYIRDADDRFFEVVVDIGSGTVAKTIVTLALGYAKSIVVDMAFVLEATQENTLPERLLGAVRLHHLDFNEQDGQRTIE